MYRRASWPQDRNETAGAGHLRNGYRPEDIEGFAYHGWAGARGA
jgi:hypothetical protein